MNVWRLEGQSSGRLWEMTRREGVKKIDSQGSGPRSERTSVVLSGEPGGRRGCRRGKMPCTGWNLVAIRGPGDIYGRHSGNGRYTVLGLQRATCIHPTPPCSLASQFSLGTAYAYQFLVCLPRGILYTHTHILYPPFSFFCTQMGSHYSILCFFNTISRRCPISMLKSYLVTLFILVTIVFHL